MATKASAINATVELGSLGRIELQEVDPVALVNAAVEAYLSFSRQLDARKHESARMRLELMKEIGSCDADGADNKMSVATHIVRLAAALSEAADGDDHKIDSKTSQLLAALRDTISQVIGPAKPTTVNPSEMVRSVTELVKSAQADSSVWNTAAGRELRRNLLALHEELHKVS